MEGVERDVSDKASAQGIVQELVKGAAVTG